MNYILRKLRVALAIAAALVGLGTTSATAVAQGVDCQLVATYCPGPPATLSFDCRGDCLPFPGICVKVTISVPGLELIHCECRGGDPTAPPRLADCSLWVIRDTVTQVVLQAGCYQINCANACTFIGNTLPNGCIELRCLCP